MYNIKDTYIDDNNPWLFVLAAAVLSTFYKENILKDYTPDQLVFGCDMIILIKNTIDW